MMKKIVMFVLLAGLLALGGTANACVGKTLFIGLINSPTEQLLGELVANLVTERTGTSVKIVPFKDERELYAAVKKGEVGLVIENRDRAFEVLGKSRGGNNKSAMELIKREYQKNLNLVWLEPFGGNPPYAPVITTETLSALPALPKLLNKLAGILSADAYARLIKAATSAEKPKKVARDFLKAKRLI